MKSIKFILFWGCMTMFLAAGSQPTGEVLSIDFLGNRFSLPNSIPAGLRYSEPLSELSIKEFYAKLGSTDFGPLVRSMKEFREREQLDDWLFYQLVRKTAQALSPKADNYFSYTLYKWFLLTRSGYEAIIRISDKKMLFYVQSEDAIYNIPNVFNDGRQYVCLNYHDYGNRIDFQNEHFINVALETPPQTRSFSYKVHQLPDIRPVKYVEKDIGFDFYQQQYHFTIRLNPEIKNIFTNYPTGDYSNQFSIPLSRDTYNSLIPQLKEVLVPMSVTNGVDYLMRFTRNAFVFEKDTVIFGREKRLSPEETLLYEQSDCEDRAALFFYLVKEIYNLPMIVLSYPEHVTVAVNFDKPVGKPIIHNGLPYYVCEPTPQKKDLALGQISPHLKKENFEIAYVYDPRQ